MDRLWRPKGKEGPSYNLDPQWNSFSTTNTYNNLGALLEVRDDTNHLWWQADAGDYDEQGRLVRFEYGNGLTTTNHFNSLTGRMEGSGIIDGISGVAEYGYQYDRLGNLTQRSLERGMTTLSESCTYDVLNRLLSSSISGSTNYSISATYNAIGNITSRSDVGSYSYSSSKPHAVASAGDCDYIYDSNGNIVRRDRNSQYEFTAAWNSFNKPTSIFAGMDGSEFEYDVNGRRTRQLIFEGTKTDSYTKGERKVTFYNSENRAYKKYQKDISKQIRQLENAGHKVTVIGGYGKNARDARPSDIDAAVKSSDLTIINAHGVDTNHSNHPARSLVSDSGDGKTVVSDNAIRESAAAHGNEVAIYGCFSADSDRGLEHRTTPQNSLISVSTHLGSLGEQTPMNITVAFGYGPEPLF